MPTLMLNHAGKGKGLHCWSPGSWQPCVSKATFLHGVMMERFPLQHFFNYKNKHPRAAVLPASRNIAVVFPGIVSIARNDENFPLCLLDLALPPPMQRLFIIAMHSLIRGAQGNKDFHMALAAALKLERAFFAISLQ